MTSTLRFDNLTSLYCMNIIISPLGPLSHTHVRTHSVALFLLGSGKKKQKQLKEGIEKWQEQHPLLMYVYTAFMAAKGILGRGQDILTDWHFYVMISELCNGSHTWWKTILIFTLIVPHVFSAIFLWITSKTNMNIYKEKGLRKAILCSFLGIPVACCVLVMYELEGVYDIFGNGIGLFIEFVTRKKIRKSQFLHPVGSWSVHWKVSICIRCRKDISRFILLTPELCSCV